jgi:hypothetical protein
MAGHKVSIQDAFQPAHSVKALRFPGWGDFYELSVKVAKDGQQVTLYLSLQFVLSRLAGEDDNEGQSLLFDHGFGDSCGYLFLVAA